MIAFIGLPAPRFGPERYAKNPAARTPTTNQRRGGAVLAHVRHRAAAYSTASSPSARYRRPAADGDGDRQPRRADPDDPASRTRFLKGAGGGQQGWDQHRYHAVPLQCGHGALGLLGP